LDRSDRRLYDAVSKGNLGEVKDLLQAGADPLAFYESRHERARGWYAVHVATQRLSVDILAVLLDNDARQLELPVHVWGGTPLFLAARYGNYNVADWLLSKGAFVEASDFCFGVKALATAAFEGHLSVVKLLIGAGAQVDAKDHSGGTALHDAAKRYDKVHVDIITVLFQHGAQLNAKDDKGKTPLIHASEHGADANVATLISLGAQLETVNNHGQTALTVAALKGHDKCAVALLAAGADPDHLDHHDNTALSYATPKVVEALADMRVSRADALAVLEVISEHLLPDVADLVMLYRYIYPYVGMAREMEAGWVARGEAEAAREGAREEAESGFDEKDDI
jgi:predicted metal-dependent enzyme (double-stranded beta helix superfamily)